MLEYKMSWHVRITLPYDACKKFIEYMDKRVAKGFVYQHSADAKVSRTHVHCIFYGTKVGSDSIRDQAKKSFVLAGLKAERNDIMVVNYFGKEKVQITESTMLSAIAYCTKGTLDPLWVKNIPADTIEDAKKKWVPPAQKKSQWNIEGGKLGIAGADDEDKKKPRVIDMQKEVAKYIDSNNLESDEEINDEITRVMKKYNHKTHMYDMMNWFDSVRFYSETQSGQFRNEVLAKINSRRRV